MFNPKSVAVIGASNTPGKVGYAIVKNMLDADFEGKIYPINLKEFNSALRITPVDNINIKYIKEVLNKEK